MSRKKHCRPKKSRFLQIRPITHVVVVLTRCSGLRERNVRKRITERESVSSGAQRKRRRLLQVWLFCCLNLTALTTPLENEENAGVSRASSVSAKDKSNIAKKGKTPKQRRDDSDSFDTRSKYAPVYGPQQQTWVQPQYTPAVNPQFNGQFQQPYQNTMQPIYGPPPPNQPYSHSPIAPNSGYVPPFNNMASVRLFVTNDLSHC